ncbi:MAG: hypothetical protein AB7D05_04530 [Mangrovibacterium sp.]
MTYLMHITSQEETDFQLQIALDAQHTFADFHDAIQKACNYSPNQMASFFLPGHVPGKQIEISGLDTGMAGFPRYTMRKTRLGSLLGSSPQRLIYVFDFFQDRCLDIQLTQILMEKNLTEPSVTAMKGDAPVQILEEEVQDQCPDTSAGEQCFDYGDLDDYTEIFGEMEDLLEGN